MPNLTLMTGECIHRCDMELSEYFDGFNRRDWQHVEDGTVRFALIGLGWWTRDRAIPAIEVSDLCETTVLVSGDHEKAQGAAETTPTAECGITYDEFHDGVASDVYDAIYISTPNALHLPFAETAADLGKGVLCEKPMEASVERAESMVETCEQANVRLMIGYRMQTEPAVRRARELVSEGFVGEPAHVNGHMTQRLLEMIPDPDQWRLDPDLAGPGASVTDLGIYPINTTRFVIDSEPKHVMASMRSTADGFEEVPDERTSFEIEFENGALAACSASQNAHESGRFEVIGTEGRIVLDPAFFGDDCRTLVVERNGTTAELAFDTVDQMTEEFDYFADRVISGGEIIPDGEHGLMDMRTIEAVYEAANSGSRIDV